VDQRRATLPWFALAALAVIVNLPLVHGTLTGARPGVLLVVITLVADAALVVAVTLRRFAPPPED
jgi:hypothetical protein